MAETKADTTEPTAEPIVVGKDVGKFLNADQILKVEDLKTEIVPVDEWGGNVIVSELMAADRDAYEQSMWNDRGNGRLVANRANARARLVVKVLVSPEGVRLFNDDSADALGAKSAAVVDRLFDVAIRLSGMEQEDVEEEGKDFDPLHNGASS
jgi:hypothetical protein